MSTTITKNKTNRQHAIAVSSNFELTNNAGIDLVVLDAFDSEFVSANELYQQALQLLQAPGGHSIIAAGNTVSFLLNGSHADNNNQVQHSDFYTLIVAQADNLFPVKVLDLNPTAAGNYASATITEADVRLAKKAENFQQQLMAFPSSDLCKKFVTALQQQDETAADAFLKSTEDFSDLNTTWVAAVVSYYNRFPVVWADYQQLKTYSLYSSNGNSNQYIGSLRLRIKAAVPPPVSAGAESYTPVFEAPDLSITTLHYQNGFFVDDLSADHPAISINGLVILKSLLTQAEEDNILISVLSGTVKGISVFGYADDSVELSTMSTELDDLLHPKDTKNWLEVAAILVGALIVFGALIYGIRRAFRARKKAEVQPDPKEQEAINQRLQEEAQVRAQIGENLVSTWEGYKAKMDNMLCEKNRSNMRDMVEKQQTYLDQIGKHTNNDDLQDIQESILEVSKTIKESTTAELSKGMKDVIRTLKNNTNSLNRAKAEFIDHVAKAIKDELQLKETLIKDLSNKIDETERNRDDWANDERPEIEG